MHSDPIANDIRTRCPRVRSGLDIGFADAGLSQSYRDLRGGVWMTVVPDAAAYARVAPSLAPGTVFRLGVQGTLPFEGGQFDVAVLNGAFLSVELVRETHRVLAADGHMLFTVPARTARQPQGYDLPTLYRLFLRNGFDVVSLHRPAWWRFGFGRQAVTVCARKKTWKESAGRIFRF